MPSGRATTNVSGDRIDGCGCTCNLEIPSAENIEFPSETSDSEFFEGDDCYTEVTCDTDPTGSDDDDYGVKSSML